MKKWHIVLIVAAVLVGLAISPLPLYFGASLWSLTSGSSVDIEIDSYRLCQDAEVAYELKYPGEDVEVEVDDYGLFDSKKEKAFKLS